MKKILIFSSVFILLVAFSSNLVYATGIDMDLTASGNDGTVYGTAPSQPTPTETSTNSNADIPVTIGTTAALSESSLSLSNILNIILIVLGVLLILFAIAILTRMR